MVQFLMPSMDGEGYQGRIGHFRSRAIASRWAEPLSDEFALQEAAAKAARAQNLLNNELLTEAFDGLEEAYTQAWRATLIDDVSGREKLFLAINIVGKVRDHLTGIVNNGKLAAAELKALADTAERKPRWQDIR
jgi:hypothetical protein